jgi:hypothetical protein
VLKIFAIGLDRKIELPDLPCSRSNWRARWALRRVHRTQCIETAGDMQLPRFSRYYFTMIPEAASAFRPFQPDGNILTMAISTIQTFCSRQYPHPVTCLELGKTSKIE